MFTKPNQNCIPHWLYYKPPHVWLSQQGFCTGKTNYITIWHISNGFVNNWTYVLVFSEHMLIFPALPWALICTIYASQVLQPTCYWTFMAVGEPDYIHIRRLHSTQILLNTSSTLCFWGGTNSNCPFYGNIIWEVRSCKIKPRSSFIFNFSS